ncbi:hypothetical protein KWI_0121860 [Xanthomonas vasicola pv. vasculorum NCPPB 206]|nr:hypothetical protein KWI_0121860 [Xanthomonas vasicola pv. vasculorum NCPPB 206]
MRGVGVHIRGLVQLITMDWFIDILFRNMLRVHGKYIVGIYWLIIDTRQRELERSMQVPSLLRLLLKLLVISLWVVRCLFLMMSMSVVCSI